jgi:eukaryotic-like serine/threonine-protein kinase
MAKRCPECNQVYDPPAKFCPFDGNPLENQKETPNKIIGMVLDGKYKVEKLIGRGGMGNVYGGRHLHIGVPVAIKVLHPHLIADDTSVERFRREARSALAVNHPNAMSVMDFGVTDSNRLLYLVMELIEGSSLYEVLDKEGALDIVRAVNLIRQVCLAVEAAHKKKIVHRDLKPDNILIIDRGKPDEMAKVIDFSIAKTFTEGTSEQMSLTRRGIVLGTPEYLSPEQAQGLQIDHRSDIYSLGIILYQMLVGEVPFTATTASVILLKHVESKPRPLRYHRSEIPEKLEAVVLRALAKQPEGRPQTAATFAEEIQDAVISAGLIKPVPTNGASAPAVKEQKPINTVAAINTPRKEEKRASIWERLFKR